MTDITKRLAEALRKRMAFGPEHCPCGHENCDYEKALNEAREALADFDRTAAQEANVQVGSAGGQWVQCGHCHGVGCKECNGSGAFTVAAPHKTSPIPPEDWARAYQAGYEDAERNLAPNAADAEAYRAVTLEDATKAASAYADDIGCQFYGKDDIDRMLHIFQSIGCVIPTAAPVPADEGEKT